MLMTYNECLKKYGTKYNIKMLVNNKKLYKQDKGIYSDVEYVPELEIISLKYPNAIVSLNSAFYYHELTDVIPDKIYLTTSKSDSKISDKRVKQIYDNSDNFEIGADYFEYNGTKILMYNKERMLIELLRHKSKLPYDYYKEILLNYRDIISDLDLRLIQDIIYKLPKSNVIMKLLQTEVL